MSLVTGNFYFYTLHTHTHTKESGRETVKEKREERMIKNVIRFQRDFFLFTSLVGLVSPYNRIH